MATRKPKDEEKLDDNTLERVHSLLNPLAQGVKPITKKEACEILNIAYNTVRLDKLLSTYLERQERHRKRKAELRGKPLSKDDCAYIIREYLLDGASIAAISDSTCHSASKIKSCLEDNGVPLRSAAYDYFKPEAVPDMAMRDRFKLGEIVWSTQYETACRIEKEQQHPQHGWVYRVWLLSERWKQYAYVPAYELASLEHLRTLGVRI